MSLAETAADPAELARWRLAAQVAVAMPELGWSASEALLMPVLLELKMPHPLLAVCWIFSPVAGLFLHPLLGSLSDKHGRRRFVFLLGFIAAAGLATIPIVATKLAGWQALTAVTLVYGLMDTSHDLLLTPTRAAMNDLFEGEVCQRRCAVGGGAGKIVALLCVVTLKRQAAFSAAALLMLSAALLQVLAPSAGLSPSEHRPRASSGGSNGVQAAAHDNGLANPVQVDGQQVEACSASAFPPGFMSVWLQSFAGWLGVTTFGFYATSAWAEHSGTQPGTPEFDAAVQVASLILVLSNVVFLFVGTVLPHIVRLCGGELLTLPLSLLGLAIAMVSFAPGVPRWVTAVAIVLVVPVGYQVVANVPLGWMENQPDFSAARRGELTGWINNSLAVAQGVTAVCSGPMVSLAGGRLFGAYASTAIVVSLFALSSFCVLGRRFRSRRSLASCG